MPMRDTAGSAHLPAGFEADEAEMLRLLESEVAALGDASLDAFYRDAAAEPDGSFAALGASALHALKARQAAHLKLLLSPVPHGRQLLRHADAIGRTLALIGASGPLLVRMRSLHRQVLSAVLERSALDAVQRYALLQRIDQRLDADLQRQTESFERVTASYFRALSRPFVDPGTPWLEVASAELRALGALPGIRAALLLRMNQEGVLTVESSAGPGAREIAEVMQGRTTSVLIDPATPRGQGLVALAWRTMQPQSTPNYAEDPRVRYWADTAIRLQVQSTYAPPVLDQDRHVVACVYLYGSYPNQFESSWIREFGRGLQRRWEQNWQHCGATNVYALPQDVAAAYRQQIFSGGLEMHVQPVIHLPSGTIHSMEALARLRMPDGTLVAPGRFLPLLGNVELDQLFRAGLAQALGWLRAQPGLPHLSVSINMAPSTLLDPDCPRWVRDALARHEVDAHRLRIELLESQGLDSAVERNNVEQLTRLGIKLSMDDLGSGYSSLERLSRLPFDVIKIDQGLLGAVRSNPERVVGLIGSLIQMARDFNREVIVEGLEDDALIEAVAALGATLGQGYGLCRPMSLPNATSWLNRYRPRPIAGDIRTAIGALAYHWRYTRTMRIPKPHTDLAACPLTAFLRTWAPHDAAAAAWHARVHAGEGEGDDVDEAGRKLGDWLVRAIAQV